MPEINYLAILGATLVQFFLGALWYSPTLFGKAYMKIMEVSHFGKEEMQKMQKEMAPYYGLQFLMTILFTFVLFYFIAILPSYSAYDVAFWMWLGIIVPTQVSGVIWGKTKKQYWLQQIAIMIGYQLVGIMLAAAVYDLV